MNLNYEADKITETINKALDEFFEETKTYIVNKYIVELDTCTDFDINFNTNIK